MTKTFTIGTVITSMWQSPLVALLILISLIFLIDIYRQYTESQKILCVPMPDLTIWSYADINTMARLHNLKPANRKKLTLIQLLQEV